MSFHFDHRVSIFTTNVLCVEIVNFNAIIKQQVNFRKKDTKELSQYDKKRIKTQNIKKIDNK